MTKKTLQKEVNYYYKDRKEKNKKLELITMYITTLLILIFIIVILGLVLRFVINILVLISMQGGLLLWAI